MGGVIFSIFDDVDSGDVYFFWLVSPLQGYNGDLPMVTKKLCILMLALKGELKCTRTHVPHIAL